MQGLQLNRWLNARMALFVILNINDIYCVISFVGILKIKEQTCFKHVLLYVAVQKAQG